MLWFAVAMRSNRSADQKDRLSELPARTEAITATEPRRRATPSAKPDEGERYARERLSGKRPQ
jgi:hypothetical protein